MPEVTRQGIGIELLSRVGRIAGQPCSDPFGTVALRRLQSGIAPGQTLHVIRDGLASSAALPGGHILLSRTLIEDFDDPSVPAGYVVAERARAEIHDPLRRLLTASGPLAAFRLLTTGALPVETLDAYAETLLTTAPLPVPDEALLVAFRVHEVPASPYAFAEDVTGETTLTLIEADPFSGTAPVSHLDDGEWLSLQGICLTG
ncbi:MAG: hypothetical protein AAF576_06650 [Pseudomonadota bacterium]